VPFWKRDEPIHEKLAREGGLLRPGEAPPHDTRPRWGEVGIHGVSRPREWDVVTAADAPELEADEVELVALADGTLIVDEGIDTDALEPVCAALESSLQPPYRATAVRQEGERFAVAARSIDVVELPDDLRGEELTLTVVDGEQTLLVDGEVPFGSAPALDRLGRDRGFDAFVVEGRLLVGTFWEVRVTPL
jgi:hypothetical protein